MSLFPWRQLTQGTGEQVRERQRGVTNNEHRTERMPLSLKWEELRPRTQNRVPEGLRGTEECGWVLPGCFLKGRNLHFYELRTKRSLLALITWPI